MISLAIMISALTRCEEDGIQQETTCDAVAAIEGDRAQANERWRDYRVVVIQDLGDMKAVLISTRKQMGVGERAPVDEFEDRIATLRHDMTAEFDEPADGAQTTRRGLEKDFEELRIDVSGLLTRLDVDR